MDEDVRTIWCGNLSDKVSEEILYELFIQGGPVQKISIPKDRDGKQKNFGFVTYKHEVSVPYALDLFDGTALFNRVLNMKSRNNVYENSQYQQQQQQQILHMQQHQQQQQLLHMQQQQQLLQMQQQQRTPKYDNRHQNVQNHLQLGQQILLGSMNPLSFAQNNMYMVPGSMSYPSQNSTYLPGQMNQRVDSDNKSNNGSSRYNNRSHPYRDQYNDRNDKHHESHNKSIRDQKSYKHASSHRSNRHDNRRKRR
ncbi:RNA-binding protein 7-like isoform X1 [Copidosoma floridanum]|uniref:RNA-binding protein 7-like isoform X1 n=1 Tax=Copidosoma floridanum TaxID=29053 RepID=UPI0006C9682F|nr:RNA-binding protein 7-like isoform X1 [Copidosoma floridanum]